MLGLFQHLFIIRLTFGLFYVAFCNFYELRIKISLGESSEKFREMNICEKLGCSFFTQLNFINFAGIL